MERSGIKGGSWGENGKQLTVAKFKVEQRERGLVERAPVSPHLTSPQPPTSPCCGGLGDRLTLSWPHFATLSPVKTYLYLNVLDILWFELTAVLEAGVPKLWVATMWGCLFWELYIFSLCEIWEWRLLCQNSQRPNHSKAEAWEVKVYLQCSQGETALFEATVWVGCWGCVNIWTFLWGHMRKKFGNTLA